MRGFVSLYGETLAALFVDPAAQGRGIGTRLPEHAKALRPALNLTVYSANRRSVAFYRRRGFTAVDERPDRHTGFPELVMEWGVEGG